MIRILITGASGFLGKICVSHFKKSGYDTDTLGISETDTIYCNLALNVPGIRGYYDWVVHLAGKAHTVPKNEDESKEFFDVNFNGTKNLLEGFNNHEKLPESIIFISSVAVYGLESGTGINEDYPLLGKTPYAESKIQAESYLQEWCLKHNVRPGILRPSLVAGKNPPGNLGAMINGIKTGKYLRIGNGNARKSIIMADDIAGIIPKVAKLGGIYNICDNYHPSFFELENLISKQLNKKPPVAIPYWLAYIFAKIGDLAGENAPINSSKLIKITENLTFSNSKARKDLEWMPMNVLDNFKIE